MGKGKFIICLALFLASFSNLTIGHISNNTAYSTKNTISYLNCKTDILENTHCIMLSGDSYLEPIQPRFSGIYNSTVYNNLTLYYGELNAQTNNLTIEKVTDLPVSLLQYNFQIDSQNRVHIAFISNFTLYYGLRDQDGWNITQLTDKSIWYSLMPDITLGQNEQPRIAYVAEYQTGASKYFGENVPVGYQSVHYTIIDQDTWKTYDIADNHNSTAKAPSAYLPLNPGLAVSNGYTYIAYNVDNQVGVSSHISYMYVPEIPLLANVNSGKTILENIYEAQVRTIRFSRPQLYVLDNRIAFTVGTLTSGGALVFYGLNNQPSSDQKDAFSVLNLESENLATAIPWISGYYDYSLNQLLIIFTNPYVNSALGTTTYTVGLTSLKFGLNIKQEGLMGLQMNESPTLYPNILSYSNSTYQISYLTGQDVNHTSLVFAQEYGPSLVSYSPPPFPTTTSSTSTTTSTIRTRIPFPNIVLFVAVIVVSRKQLMIRNCVKFRDQ